MLCAAEDQLLGLRAKGRPCQEGRQVEQKPATTHTHTAAASLTRLTRDGRPPAEKPQPRLSAARPTGRPPTAGSSALPHHLSPALTPGGCCWGCCWTLTGAAQRGCCDGCCCRCCCCCCARTSVGRKQKGGKQGGSKAGRKGLGSQLHESKAVRSWDHSYNIIPHALLRGEALW